MNKNAFTPASDKLTEANEVNEALTQKGKRITESEIRRFSMA
jgi:hypothetical protein